MENNEITPSLRTPLAVKTQKNFQTIKNEHLKNNQKSFKKIDESLKIPKDNKFKNTLKTNNITEEINENSNNIEELDDFSYNNFNANFTKKPQNELIEIEEDKIEPIELIQEPIILQSNTIQYERLHDTDIQIKEFIDRTLNKEIIYVNSKDFDRKRIVDNFVNEGLFFSEFD